MLSAQNTSQDFFPQKGLKKNNNTILKAKNSDFQKNQQHDNCQLSTRLEKVQNQIDTVAGQLVSINEKMQQQQKNQGKYVKFTTSYLALERQRNNFRKKLIDLDLQHKQIYFCIIKQNQSKKDENISSEAENHPIQKLQQQSQNLNLQKKDQNSQIKDSQHVRFYQNSQIALDVSRTQLQKSKEFFTHNRQFSFSNVYRIDSIEIKPNQNQTYQVIQKKQTNSYPLKQNLFQNEDKINAHRQKDRLKTYEMQVRLALQKQKLQKRLKYLNSYNYLKAKEYESIQTRRFPSLYHGLIGWRSIYNPMRFY